MYRVCLLWASLPEIKTIDWFTDTYFDVFNASTRLLCTNTFWRRIWWTTCATSAASHSRLELHCPAADETPAKKTCCTVTETKFSLLTLQCSQYRMVWRGRRKVRRRRTWLSSQPALLQGYHFFKNKTLCIFYHGCHYHSANICF